MANLIALSTANTDHLNQYYRISPQHINNVINIDDYVKNNYNNLYGKVINKDNQYIVIAWDDNTYERIKLEILDNSLIKISAKEYTDNVSTSENNLLKNDFLKNDKPVQPKPVKKNKTEIEQLVNLAVEKGIIDFNDIEVETAKIESFDAKALQQYKDMVTNFNDDGEVTSLSSEEIKTQNIQGLSPDEIKAQNMLQQLKQQRGIVPARQKNIDVNNTDSRSLKDINNEQVTFINTNNGTVVNKQRMSFEDSLFDSLQNDTTKFQDEIKDNNKNFKKDNDSSLDESFVNNESSINSETFVNDEEQLNSIMNQLEEENKNTSNFLKLPFNGITKPLLINAPDNINPVNTAFKDLFSPDMWTSLGRR